MAISIRDLQMKWVLILLIIIWIYALSVFKRKKQAFFHFLVGSIGLFLFSFVILYPVLTAPLSRFVCDITGVVGEMLGIFKAYSSYGILFIENVTGGPVSLYVDFECAGLVENLVFLSLLIFFPAYKWYEKIWVGIAGVAGVMAANVLRLTVICVMIHVYGNEIYYLAHTIVGRMLFYALSIMLYFYIFTRRQIKQQKVGDFSYHGETD